MTPDSPTDVSAFLPAKKEDRPQPEGASCEAAAGHAAPGAGTLTECGQMVTEQVPKSGGPQPQSLRSSPGTELLDARIVMGEEALCLGVAIRDAPGTIPSEETRHMDREGSEPPAALQGAPLPPVARDFGNRHSYVAAPPPGLPKPQEPAATSLSLLSQGEPKADVPSPPPTLAKELPAGLAEAPLFLAKPTGSLEPELYFTAPSTPIRTVFPHLRQTPFPKDSLSEEQNDMDSEGLCSPPTSPSGSYITAEGSSWTSSGTASSSPSCSPNLLAEPDTAQAPAATEEAGLSELGPGEGEATLSRGSCPLLGYEGVFRGLSFRPYPAEEGSGDEEEEGAPLEEGWVSESPLPQTAEHPSWAPDGDDSEDAADLSASPLEDDCPLRRYEGIFRGLSFIPYPAEEGGGGEEEEGAPLEEGWVSESPLLQTAEHPLWAPDSDDSEDTADLSASPLEEDGRASPLFEAEVRDFPKRGSEACPFARPLAAVSGPPPELGGVLGVGHTEAAEPAGPDRQPPASSPEEGVETAESDRMIPALFLPFRGSLLFEAESMEITLFPPGEVVENDALYGGEEDDSTSVSFLHSLSETSLDEGVDETFAYPDDTSPSSGSASDDGEGGPQPHPVVPQAGATDPVVEAKEEGRAPSPPDRENQREACGTDEDTVQGAGEEAPPSAREGEEESVPQEEEGTPEDPRKPPQSFDAMVVSRPESPGSSTTSRSSCNSPLGPGEASLLEQDSAVTSEEVTSPTQGETEDASLKELLLAHLSPTHRPPLDVRSTPLESGGLPEGGECLIACFDTDDELDNQPPSALEDSPLAGPFAEEWVGRVSAESVITLGWNPQACPVELEDLDAVGHPDSSSPDMGARLEESEKRLMELLDQDGATSRSSADLDQVDAEMLDAASSEKERPFAAPPREAQVTLLEQREVTRADAETTQDILVACLESDDELEEASSLDQLNNNEDRVIAAFSEAESDALLAPSHTPENLLGEDNGILLDASGPLPPASPPGVEQAAELQNWSMCGTQNSSIDPEIEDYSGHFSSEEGAVDDTTAPSLSELCLETGETETLNGRETREGERDLTPAEVEAGSHSAEASEEDLEKAEEALDLSREELVEAKNVVGAGVEPQRGLYEEGHAGPSWGTPSEDDASELESEEGSNADVGAEIPLAEDLQADARCFAADATAPLELDISTTQQGHAHNLASQLSGPKDANTNVLRGQEAEAISGSTDPIGAPDALATSDETTGHREEAGETVEPVDSEDSEESIECPQRENAPAPEARGTEAILQQGTGPPKDGEGVESVESPHDVGDSRPLDPETGTVETVPGVLPIEQVGQTLSDPTDDVLPPKKHPDIQKKTFAQALLQGLLPVTETRHPHLEEAVEPPLFPPDPSEESYSHRASSFLTAPEDISNRATLLAPSPASEREEFVTSDQTWGGPNAVVEESRSPQGLEAVTAELENLMVEVENLDAEGLEAPPECSPEEALPQQSMAVCLHYNVLARAPVVTARPAAKPRDASPKLGERQWIFLASEDQIYLSDLREAQGSLSSRPVEVEPAEAGECLEIVDKDLTTAGPETSTPTVPQQLQPTGALFPTGGGPTASAQALEDHQQVTGLLQGSFGNPEERRVEAAHLIGSLLVAEAQDLLGSLKENVLESFCGDRVGEVAEAKHPEELEAPRTQGEEAADPEPSAGQPGEEAKAEDQAEMAAEGGTGEDVLPVSEGTYAEDALLGGPSPNEAAQLDSEDSGEDEVDVRYGSPPPSSPEGPLRPEAGRMADEKTPGRQRDDSSSEDASSSQDSPVPLPCRSGGTSSPETHGGPAERPSSPALEETPVALPPAPTSQFPEVPPVFSPILPPSPPSQTPAQGPSATSQLAPSTASPCVECTPAKETLPQDAPKPPVTGNGFLLFSFFFPYS